MHDDTKDKPFELELAWVTAANGWKAAAVSPAATAAAEAWAKAELAKEEEAAD